MNTNARLCFGKEKTLNPKENKTLKDKKQNNQRKPKKSILKITEILSERLEFRRRTWRMSANDQRKKKRKEGAERMKESRH